MDSSLEEVVLTDDRVEERLDVDATILVSVEFQERGCAEEVPTLHRQLRGDGEEAVVVDALLAVVRRRIVFSQQLIQQLHVCVT